MGNKVQIGTVQGDAVAGNKISAGKAGSIAALSQVLNHLLASFVIAALEDWQSNKNASKASGGR